MDRTNLIIVSLFFAFALFVLGGFYLVFDKMSTIQLQMKDLELSLRPLQSGAAPQQPETPPPPEASPAAATSSPTSTPVTAAPAIQTAIIFQTTSSPSLQPQTKLTVQIERVTKETGGTVVVDIKVFTGEATSYSAIDAATLFQVINLEGGILQPTLVTGPFSSMPAKSAVSGSVVFKTDPAKRTMILQIGIGEGAVFYEFDFDRKTYHEAVIG